MMTIFIRLEARLRPYVLDLLTSRRDLAVFTRSAVTPNANVNAWSTLSTFLGAGPGRFWARSAQ